MSSQARTQVESDSACFVCGQENPIGLKTKFRIEKESCTSRAVLTLTENYQGWHDVVHGGILAALLDEACIYACMAKAKQVVTAELQIRYRKPVPVGAEVEVTGELIDSSRKIWQAKARLKIAETLYAEATAKVFVLDH